MFFSLYLAELPDKTSLATLALLRRHRALWVWLGSASALVAQTVLALTAGRLLALVPQRPLTWLEILLFLGFAIWLWKESGEEDEAPESAPRVASRRALPVIGQTFLFVFVAEFLDLTQMATMAFAAKHPHNLVILGAMASLALVAANATVVLFGQVILARISGMWLQRIAALLFGVIAVGMGIAQFGLSIV